MSTRVLMWLPALLSKVQWRLTSVRRPYRLTNYRAAVVLARTGPIDTDDVAAYSGGAVVCFGEVPEGMSSIAKELNWTGLLIVVGMSSLVHLPASFARTLKSRGGKIAIFNLERSQVDENADFLFLGPCEVTLPSILGVTT